MKKIALSIKQMNHLRKLGLDTSDASLCWTQDPNGEIWRLGIHDEFCYESSYMNPVPAYTLHDILDKLPESIGAFDLYMRKICSHYVIGYCFGNETKESCMEKNIIDAAYELLVWCIEEGYVKTEGGGNA